MRFQPVLAKADPHFNRHIERKGGLHLVADQRHHFFFLGPVQIEDQFVVHLRMPGN